jgi:hypothetical protein
MYVTSTACGGLPPLGPFKNPTILKEQAFFLSVQKRECLINKDKLDFLSSSTPHLLSHPTPLDQSIHTAATLLPQVNFFIVFFSFFVVLAIARIQCGSTRKSTSASTGRIHSRDSATQAGM